MQITSVVHRSIDRIPREDWDCFLGEEPEGYDYFRVLERSGLKEFSFAYVCVHCDGELALIAPLFWCEFDLAIGTEGLAGRAVRLARRLKKQFLIERTLFCGSPFGEHGIIGIARDSSVAAAALQELVRVMDRLCGEENLAFILFKDFDAARMAKTPDLRRLGFIRGESFPNLVLPLPYLNVDGYLGSLSHNRRKDLRRKLRKAEASATLSVTVVDEVEALLPEVYQLYLNTYNAGTVRFEKLTPEYFREVGRCQKGQAKFFLFWANGKLVCFNLCFLHNRVLTDKFIGLDYAAARRLNLYFYTWHHNVQWCLQHGVKAYQVGQTDYEAKEQLGGKRVPLYFWARHRNRFFHTILRMVAPLLAPDM